MAGLVTDRLRLRQWRDADLDPFAALNAHPEVMRFLPDRLTRAQSDQLGRKLRATIDRQGWGLWAVEVARGPSFIGFVGLSRTNFRAHFTPAVEVGWRLDRSSWGNGYATEAASAAVSFAFEPLRLAEIVSFTSAINERSIGVMRRIGMSHDPADDFDHPGVPDGPLRRHVLYRLHPPARCAPGATLSTSIEPGGRGSVPAGGGRHGALRQSRSEAWLMGSPSLFTLRAMTRHKHARAAVLMISAAVAMSIPAAVGAKVGPAHSPSFAPCKLLKKSEVAVAIGEPQKSAKGGKTATGARFCNFDGHTSLIAVRLIAARDFAKQRFKQYKQLLGPTTTVKGVGDAAATDGSALIARVGNNRFVYVAGRDASGSKIALGELTTLAKKALGRLK